MVAKAQVGRHVLHMLNAAIHLVGFCSQGVRLRRRDETGVATLEERDARLDFKVPDEPTDPRRGDVQQPGRIGRGAGCHDGPKDFDLAQSHAGTYYRLFRGNPVSEHHVIACAAIGIGPGCRAFLAFMPFVPSLKGDKP